MVLSAENFLNNNYYNIILDSKDTYVNISDIKSAMVEFAKEHVKEALSQAAIYSKNENKLEWYQSNDCPDGMWIPKNSSNSVLNCYPEENVR